MIGEIIHKYRIEKVVCQNTTGVLYHAIDTETNKGVSLKLINKKVLSPFQEDCIRFKSEIERLKTLRHEKLLNVYAYGEYEQIPYVVMEETDYITLDNAEDLSLDAYVKILIQILMCLKYLHENGLIHKTISASSILVSKDGEVKLFDCGFSYIIELKKIKEPDEVIKNFGYMSPEATGILNRNIDERSDLYSLGIVFYKLLTKTPPFREETVSKILHQLVAVLPQRPGYLNKNIPLIIDEIIMKLLQKDPDLRYQSTNGLIYDLERYESGEREFIIAQKDPKLKLSYKTRMIGREEEFDKIRALFKYAQEGHGNICLIAGEAGIGKSRFVEEVKSYVHANNSMFIWGRCVNKDNKTPYHPFKLVLEEYFKIIEKMENEEKSKSIDRIKLILGDLGEIIAKVHPEIERLIGETEPLTVLELEKENKRFLMVIGDFICKLTEGIPCVIYLDDLQWADEGSLSILVEIAHKISNSNLLILGTYRDNEVGREHTLGKLKSEAIEKKYSLVSFKLGKLTNERIKRLISYNLGEKEEVLEKLAQYIFEKSDGNPYFAINILRELVEEKAVLWRDGNWFQDWLRITNMPVSATLIDIVLKRIDKISEKQKDTLSVAAVIGREFDAEMLFKLITLSKEDIIKILDQLTEEGLIEKNIDSGNLLFVHDRVRDAFLVLLKEEEKKEIHKNIAKILEGYELETVLFDIVHHYLEANDTQNILKYIFLAGDRAKESYSNEDAVRYYRKGLYILKENGLEKSNNWISASENLSEVYLTIGENDIAISLCEQLLCLKETNLEKARIYKKIGIAYFKKGDWENCENNLSNCLLLLGEKTTQKNNIIVSLLMELCKHFLHSALPPLFMKGDENVSEVSKEIVLSYITLNWVYVMSDTKKFIYNVLKMLNIAEQKIGVSKELGVAIGYYAAIMMAIPFFKLSIKYNFQALEIRKNEYDNVGIAQSYQLMGYCFLWKGDYKSSIYYFKESIKNYELVGDLWEIGMSKDSLGFAYYFTGNYSAAINSYEEYLKSSIEINNAVGECRGNGNIARCIIEKGNFKRAEELIIKSLKMSKEINQNFVYCYELMCMGFLELERGEFKKSIGFLIEAKEIIEKNDFIKEYIVPVYSLLAEAYIEIANTEKNYTSRQNIRFLIKLALSKTKPWANNYGHALRVTAKYNALLGKNKKSEKYFKMSISQTKAIGRKFENLKGYFEYGFFLKSLNRDIEAQGLLLEAYKTSKEIGAQKYVRVLEEILNINLQNAKEESTSVDRLNIERKMKTVLDSSRHLSSILDLNELLEKIMDEAMELSGAERGLLLIRAEDGNLCSEVKRNISEEEIYSKDFEASNETIRKVEKSKEPLLLADLDRLEGSIEIKNNKTEVKSVICAPIISKNEVLGVLYLDNRLVSGLFKESELDVINLLSSQAGVSIDNAKLFKKATTDGLTGIFNRAFLDNYLLKNVQEAHRYNKKISLLMMDIDHFKRFNDNYGHLIGDLVLQNVAKKTEEVLRKSDIVARYGGEEFVVILPETGIDGAKVAAEKIRKAIEENVIKNINQNGEVQKLKVMVSIGVAELIEREDRLALIKRADECLYKAKNNGRNMVVSE